jgi:hypothetical protein
MKSFFCLLVLGIFSFSCSKHENFGSMNSEIMGVIKVAPQNFRLKTLENKSVFLQPEEHFQYDNYGRVSVAADSLTAQPASENVYTTIPVYVGNNVMPLKMSRYWTFWMNGIQSTPFLTEGNTFSYNSSGQVVTILPDSSSINETFQYSASYIIIRHFRKGVSAEIYYDSALTNNDHNIIKEFRMYSDSLVGPIGGDTLTYKYTSSLNPEYYVPLFEDYVISYLEVPVVAVSKHLPESIISTTTSESVSYAYQNDNQGRVLTQTDDKGNLIKTYSYY